MAELTIEERSGFALAAIMARRGADAAAIGTALGVAAPDQPGWSGSAELALIGTGPGTWLAMAETAPSDWIGGLRCRLDGIASVSDQSGGYVILRLSGKDARTILQRGAAIDLHPDRFGPESAVVTSIAQAGAIIRQIDGRPTYDMAVPRSFAKSLQAWLDFAIRTGD